MTHVVKWASVIVAIVMAGAAIYHGDAQFGWIAAVFIAVAGGEEVVEIIRQVRP